MRFLSAWPRLGVLLALVALAALLACAPSDTETRSDTFVLENIGTLVVDADNANIKIESSIASVVEITAVIRDSARVEYEAIQDGNTVRVSAKTRNSLGFFQRRGGVEITARAPETIALALQASNGSIEVDGVIVPDVATFKTSNGSIHLTNVRGLGDVATAGGSVMVLPGLEASTANGSVTLENVTGDVKLSTSNSRIQATAFTGQIDARASNGAIEFAGTLLPDSRNRLRTSNGAVEIDLGGTSGVKLRAVTSNGQVSSHRPLAETVEAASNHLEGTIGDGSAELEVETSNGSITIR